MNLKPIKIKVRKWLPSYVSVSFAFKPKKGKGSFRRNKKIEME